MKVSLIYPPQAQPFLPHPALPIVAAILRAADYTVKLHDFNLDAYLHYLSPQVLKQHGMKPEWADEVSDALDSLRHGGEFFGEEAYFHSIKYIQDCLAYVSRPYQGLTWNLKLYKLRDYSTARWADIDKATQDRGRNLFIDYYQSRMAEMAAENPQLVGITVAWEAQLIPAFTLARLLKQHIPGVKICFGGSMISHLVDYFKQMPAVFAYVDYYLPFQGEAGIVPLMRHLEDRGRIEDVPGLVYLGVDGQVKTNCSSSAKTMTLPLPDFTGLALDKYLSPRPYLPLVASRGCYYAKCAFCSHHISGMNFNSHRVDEVLAEMDALHQKHGCCDFYFSDDSLPPSLAVRLSKLIAEQNRPYRWMAEIRFEKMMTSEYFQILYAGGCRVLLFGLESGNDRVAELMAKGTTKAHAAQTLANASRAGIVTWTFFFLGFPGESEQEGRDTMDFLRDNREHIDMIAGGPFVLTRNSPIFDQAEKFGVASITPNPSLDLQLAYDYTLIQGSRWQIQPVLEEYSRKEEFRQFSRPFVVETHLLYFRKSSFGAKVLV